MTTRNKTGPQYGAKAVLAKNTSSWHRSDEANRRVRFAISGNNVAIIFRQYADIRSALRALANGKIRQVRDITDRAITALGPDDSTLDYSTARDAADLAVLRKIAPAAARRYKREPADGRHFYTAQHIAAAAIRGAPDVDNRGWTRLAWMTDRDWADLAGKARTAAEKTAVQRADKWWRLGEVYGAWEDIARLLSIYEDPAAFLKHNRIAFVAVGLRSAPASAGVSRRPRRQVRRSPEDALRRAFMIWGPWALLEEDTASAFSNLSDAGRLRLLTDVLVPPRAQIDGDYYESTLPSDQDLVSEFVRYWTATEQRRNTFRVTPDPLSKFAADRAGSLAERKTGKRFDGVKKQIITRLSLHLETDLRPLFNQRVATDSNPNAGRLHAAALRDAGENVPKGKRASVVARPIERLGDADYGDDPSSDWNAVGVTKPNPDDMMAPEEPLPMPKTRHR
jgi:hypothetical protein